MRREGNEFGSTTGRPRRCGWLDLPALKYAIMLNGVNSLIMMKADVLNQFPVIKICTDYQMNNEVMDTYPFEPGDEQLQLLFREMKGWEGSLTNCRSIAEIPAELSDYIGFIEKAVGLPIEIISIGPDRLETLQR